MPTAYVQSGVVLEILPGSSIPLTDRYTADFLSATQTVSANVLPGWTWNGTAFAAPVVSQGTGVPQTVSKVQAVLALHAQAGAESGKTLLDDVTAAVAASTDPRVALAWNNAASIDRNGTFVETVAKAAPLSMTDAQLDALFTAAAQIIV